MDNGHHESLIMRLSCSQLATVKLVADYVMMNCQLWLDALMMHHICG